MLRALRAETGIAYDERSQGTLQLFRTGKLLEGASEGRRRAAQPRRPSRAPRRRGLRPRPSRRLPGCGRSSSADCGSPEDETGDCFKFSLRLALSRRGAQGRLPLWRGHQPACLLTAIAWAGVATDRGPVSGDAYVLALGSHSPLLLKPLGISLPVYPVKGYSLTVPITHPLAAPEFTVMDEKHKVAITRLGDRIRVGGMAGRPRLQRHPRIPAAGRRSSMWSPTSTPPAATPARVPSGRACAP